MKNSRNAEVFLNGLNQSKKKKNLRPYLNVLDFLPTGATVHYFLCRCSIMFCVLNFFFVPSFLLLFLYRIWRLTGIDDFQMQHIFILSYL